MITHHVKHMVQEPTSQDHGMTVTANAQPQQVVRVKVARLPGFQVHTIILSVTPMREASQTMEWNVLSATLFAQALNTLLIQLNFSLIQGSAQPFTRMAKMLSSLSNASRLNLPNLQVKKKVLLPRLQWSILLTKQCQQ